MKIRIDIDIDRNEAERLVVYAINYGYRKNNEKLRWNEKDTKEAVKYGIAKLLRNFKNV